MKTSTVLAAASAAVASAQLSFDNTTGTYTCAKPGQAYCAGTSLGTDIIIRCDETGKGQPGRCSDNLAGEPPLGVSTALCFETSDTTGDAACEKNCVIYGGSGNFPGTSTLPASVCTPTYTAGSTSSTGTGGGASSTGSKPGSSKSTTLTTITSAGHTTPCPTPSGTGGSSSRLSIPSNGTLTIIPPPTGGPTKTPVGPTSNPTQTGGSGSGSGSTSIPTAAAAANRVGGALAALGLAAVYLL